VQDACRFILYHRGAIESAPLQAYMSALIFSPKGSLIQNLFRLETPKDIVVQPGMADYWSDCLQTLEGHSSGVQSVIFSHDAAQLASASADMSVKIWDAGNGAYLQTLKGHTRAVNSVAYSHDSTRLASASDDSTVKIWNARSGACLYTLP
jgi:WD40 repeat protein